MNIAKKTIDRIRELQTERNWSVNHLALEAGISSATILTWYSKNSLPSLKAIYSLCDAFGITISQFFGGESTSLTTEDDELLREWRLMHKEEKQTLLAFIKSINRTVKSSNTL